ncbi:hypothetical protein GB937_002487 [Aspergillus fischeri]|nr:hypothetical protein GB937_002487 [Aspergillus fischeri]
MKMKSQLLWLVASTISTGAATPIKRALETTYFFTFGDSYSQTGFSTSGEQPSASNPMGNPALGTGTTAGGVNWVGYLTTAENASLVLSYDLAVGGATINGSLVGSTANDLVGQVKTFDATYSSKPASAPWSFEDAVFAFWIGINDIGNAYYRTNASTFVPQLIGRLEDLAKDIYSSGGRKFLFVNVPPINRTPMFIQQGDWAIEHSAAYLAFYNQQLATMVERFKSNNTSVTAVLYDSWSFMTKVLDNPTVYGFPDATCINENGMSCVWWNDYHPGTKYHQRQAEDMKASLAPLGAW